jgi:membrane protein YdbS with pleckstrin-like domain
MIYRLTRALALRVMRCPEGPPDPPAGSHASVEVFRASPRYLGYRLALFWIGSTLLWLVWWGLCAAALLEDEPAALGLVLALGLFLLAAQLVAYFCLRLDYDLRYYVVTDRSLRTRHGALIVREMTVTHANVQNLRVVQGPIQKLFGLFTLRVDTAGGGAAQGHHQRDTGHAVCFEGIADAHAIRDLILAHLRQRGRDAGLGDPDDPGGPARATSPRVLDALRAVRDSAAALRRECAGRI